MTEPPNAVIDRMMLILSAFDTDRVLSVSELARRTGLAKSTVHRMAGTLLEHGVLERSGVRFTLGLRLFELGERVPRKLGLREAALPYMADLRAATRQTVHLAVLDGTDVVYLEIFHNPDAPPLPSRTGGRLPAHATGVGKAMLAFSPQQVLDEVLHRGLRRVAERTITDPAMLTRQLRTARANGVANDYEESGAGIVCAASPILNTDQTVAGAISVSGLSGRLDLRRMTPAVRTAALAISRTLGART
ncbi:IclR family transcriptional regulator [Sciscionella sediminilitoris]|uniref:IclR family transcriptional regulator n=1 Tax=Sciscionella sediminilitoris TaxID=1445613 RepID=UPI0004DF66CB|nr:IclR family transcriptional regulator [Sciscionella sp. SE31]